MKKILLLSFCLLWFSNVLNAQSQSLPYYTGFDSTSQQAGWQEFRLGILSSNKWTYTPSVFSSNPFSLPYALYHDYNASGSTDTVEDWFVSPPLKISTSAKLTLKIFPTIFGTQLGIWLGTGTNNPASGNFIELGYFDLQYTGQWVDTFVNITTITDTGYIAFKYVGSDYNSLVIDNVNIIPDNYPETIDSLKIIPNNPTTLDTVKVIGYTFHPYSDCPLTSSSVNINNDTITVNVSHTLGIMPTTCNSIDTLTIGVLNAGTYELTYHLADTAPPTTYDIDTITFTIQQPSGLQPPDHSEQEIEVYPNPITSQINIGLKTLPADKYHIDFYSILGQKIKTIKADKNIVSVDISNFTEGVYFIVITDGHGRRWARKVIKNAP